MDIDSYKKKFQDIVGRVKSKPKYASFGDIAWKVRTMHQFDSNGWDNIHSAAFKGFIPSLEKLIEKHPEKLELTTNDELRSTPLLLAVMSGNLETVQELIKLGAQIHTRNSQGHGIIELTCLRKDIDMLNYFLQNVDENVFPVWVHLVDFVDSIDDEESIHASSCINQILINNKLNGDRFPYIQNCITADIVSTIIKVIKGTQGYECKKESLKVLTHFIVYQVVRESFIEKGGLEVILPLLRPPSNPDIARIVVRILDILIVEPNGFSERIFHSGVIVDLNKILEWSSVVVEEKYQNFETKSSDETVDEDYDSQPIGSQHSDWFTHDLLKEIFQFFGNLAEIHPTYQNSIGKEPGCLSRLSTLFMENENRSLLIELTKCVAKLANENIKNQQEFMKDGIENSIINLTRAKDKEMRLVAVDAIINLAKGNIEYQNQLMQKNAHKPLLLMLRKSGRNITVNEKASTALWSLAGHTSDSKSEMASLIGVDLLIDFLQTPSDILQLIGSEAIFVISGGPTSQRDVIGKKNGIQPLINLLKSDNIDIVLSCIRSLRQLCVKLGYLAHVWNQHLVILTKGLHFLVGLMRTYADELVQVEAAYTIASVTMRNEEALDELHTNSNFNYVYILEKMYSSNPKIRLLAGASLAAFAYNNLIEQKKIAKFGGIRFKCLQPFLFSEDEYEKCMSAFQLIILSRVIPDEELAVSTGFGIKTLIETLSLTKNSDVQELGCDCVTRLCHTKAGIANAMISFGIVDILCTLLVSYVDSVKGTAALAVKYLSFFPESRRQILRKCRRDPYLMKVIMFYNKENKIDPEFMEGWQHYKRVGLPKIDLNRPFLTTRKEIDLFKDLNEKQITLFSNSEDYQKIGSLTERHIVTKFPDFRNQSPQLQKIKIEIGEIESLDEDLENSERKELEKLQNKMKQVSFYDDGSETLNT